VSTPKARKSKRAIRADLPALSNLLSNKKHKILGRTLSVLDDNYQWLPDSSVDLVLTDPPFNIAQDTNFHTYENNTINSYRFDADKGWDSYTPESFIELLNDWAKEFARVLRPGGSFAVFCADDYLSHLINALTAAGLNPRRTLTWRKPNAVPINRKTMMMSACEYIVTGVKGGNATFNSDLYLENLSEIEAIEKVLISDKAAAVVEKAVREALDSFSETGEERVRKIAEVVKEAVEKAGAEAGKRAKAMYVDEGSGWMVRGCVPNYISFNSKAGNRLHPTEKPVTLLSYLVYLLSRPGDVILDPFAGSGSTGEAGLLAGRSVILIEMDNEFYSSLTDRLKKLSKGH
jgi:site-specific DNA-methyltransferase (adenine-specific)